MHSSLLLLLIQSAPPVTYEVGFPNAVHHEAEIAATFSGLPPVPLEVWMSRGSPGRCGPCSGRETTSPGGRWIGGSSGE